MAGPRRRYGLFTEALAWLVCVLFFSPMLFIVMNAFKDYKEIILSPVALPSRLAFENFALAWQYTDFGKTLFNSFFISAAGSLGTVLLASMAAYMLARTPTRSSRVLFTLFMLAMMVPFQTVMLPIARISKELNLNNSVAAVPVIYIGYSCSMAVLLYHGFIKGIPKEIEESAFIDGCSRLRMFFRVVFPLLMPISSTVLIIYALQFWNDLLIPLILISKKSAFTIPLAQMAFYGHFTTTDWNLLLASAVITSLPVLLLYAALQKKIIGGLVAGAVKG